LTVYNLTNVSTYIIPHDWTSTCNIMFQLLQSYTVCNDGLYTDNTPQIGWSDVTYVDMYILQLILIQNMSHGVIYMATHN